jgi:arabinogalactan endo-1,4-beta-galactosidase
MIQIGNETTGGLCGERNWISIAKLMNAGSRAAREVSAQRKRPIQVALHFTNPEKAGEYERFVKILQFQEVDYDVFASSYYPWWHGSPENFAQVLKRTAQASGKAVMCAEFSYAYTYDDGDGFPNTISRDTACAKPYPITVQGQADALRDLIAAVASAGGNGAYYWEPAWIPVPGKDVEARKTLWEKYGSGWASSAAAEYDPADAGKYFGGTSWDNQALFGPDGRPLESLSVFKYAATGAVTGLRPDSVAESLVRVRLRDAPALPRSVTVLFNDGSSKSLPVAWEESGSLAGASAEYGKAVKVSEMSSRGVAEYDLFGRILGQEAGPSVPRAYARIQVVEKNYVENPSFEEADLSMWKIENIGGKTTELFVQDKAADAKSGTKALHFWSKDKVAFKVEQTVKGLAPGKYKFSLVLHGGDAKNQDMAAYAASGGKTYEVKTDVDGWRNFRTPTIPEILVSDGTVTIGARVACDANGWGSLDDFILAPVE